MVNRAALILAGGRARRFQCREEEWEDKATAQLLGKPLLVHAVENACVVVDEVVVCVNDEARKAKYAQILQQHNLDKKVSHISGPILAIMTGLKSVQADLCMTLPCDMPLMKPKVMEYLFDAAGDVEVAVPIWPNGRLETLVTVLKRDSAREITQTLCELRRPRSDDIMRGASQVLFVSPMAKIKTLDPELKSFVNINRREDLSKLQTRAAHGSITSSFRATFGLLLVAELKRLRQAAAFRQEHQLSEAQAVFSSSASELEKAKSFFWAGISRENEGETLLAWSKLEKDPAEASDLDFRGKDAFLAAANDYRLEAEMHFEGGCRFLGERAWADKAWCEGWVMGKAGHSERYPPKY
jgi:molybdopterin-guanine dinucleotide biosynthesis protein A